MIGSGPGGAIAAWTLAKTGRRVIVVEAGPKVRRSDFRRDAGYTLSRFFWYGGMRTTRGNIFMPTMQARNLGGGSVWNSAICMRTPEFILERWEREHGLYVLLGGRLDRHYEEVERFMGIRAVDPSVQGPRNDLFRAACDSVGFKPTVIERNEDGCQGSGECFTGCPNEAKLSTDRRGIPEVIDAGGTVYTSVVADELIVSGKRVRGMVGRVVEPFTQRTRYKVRITAKTVVLAAGALASPDILQRSGIHGPGVGSNLRFHPGNMVMGIFDDEVHPWSGATQGYHCLDFLQDGIKLEALWATPSLMAFRFPGFGSSFQDQLKQYKYMASWDAWVSGEDSVGHVRRQRGQRPDVYYEVGAGDVRRMAEAMAKLTEMFFAVGAKKVLLGVHGLPDFVTSPAAAEQLRNQTFAPNQFPLASNHVFGSTGMGGDPRRHAADGRGKVYDWDGIYVADTGILPGTPGVNPMLPVMALSHRIAEGIASEE